MFRNRTSPVLPCLLSLLTLLSLSAAVACGGGRTEPDAHGEHASGDDAAEEEHAGHDDHGAADADGVVALSPRAVERIGLRTATVERRPVGAAVGTTGTVGYDERRLAHLGPRLEGRLVRVEAELGERVAAGQVLARVDSLALGQARAELLRARAHAGAAGRLAERRRALLGEGLMAEQEVVEAEAMAAEAAAAVAAAEDSLRLFGLSEREIGALARGEGSLASFSLRAPFAGRVVEKEAVVGEMVEPHDRLFTVADLSTVWVWIDVYERDLARVRHGDPVRVALDAFPGEVFTGRLSYLGDRVRPESRTLHARVDVPNPGGRLRPGMFARVLLADEEAGEDGDGRGAAAPLTVPASALQRHDGGHVVFVALGEGRFARRPVVPGRRGAGRVEIAAGLDGDETVVVEGAFLLKSEAAGDRLGGHHHH